MIKNPLADKIYWCILPSDENQAYGDTAPVEPWDGKLVISERNVLFLHDYNEKTGEVDFDRNASAIAEPSDLFETKEEAMVEYKKAVIKYALEKMREIYSLLESIQDD